MRARAVLRRWRSVLLVLAVIIAPHLPAETYPTRTIRIISPYQPGGPNDVLARIVAQQLGTRLGQPVIVENRVGAGGTIGADIVAKAKPDGHTLLMMALAHCAHGSLYATLPYDLEQDFAPITQVAVQPLLLVVGNQVAARSVQQFIALARQKHAQGKALFFASGGNGTSQHLAMEMFNAAAKVRLTHVPYKGLGAAFSDMFNGQVQAMMSPISSALPHVRAGTLRALAITSAARSALAPAVPTLQESGLKGFAADTWHGLAAPAKTPRAIVERLQSETAAALKTKAVRERLSAQGAEAIGNTSDEFGKLIRTETAKYAKIVRAAGIKLD